MKKRITKRDYKVKVFSVSPAFEYRGDFTPARVDWVGTGSYWFWVDMDKVEKYEKKSS